MAKGKDASDNASMKQTTLKGFFNRVPQPSPATPVPKNAVSTSMASTIEHTSGTPGEQRSSSPTIHSSSNASQSSIATRKPASNPKVSTTMSLDDEDEDDGVEVVLSSARRKRKLVVDEDSDADADSVPQTSTVFADKLVGFKKTAPVSKKPVAKRSRVSALLSDDDDDENEDTSSRTSAPLASSTRASSSVYDLSDDDDEPVTRKKAPVARKHKATSNRSSKASSRASSNPNDSDDAFVVADGDEDEVDSGQIDDEEEDEAMSRPVKSKRAPATKSRSIGNSRPSMLASAASSGSFLTAAEQRARTQKSEKKGKDEYYSFLKVRKDKNGNLPDSPDFDPRTLYIPESARKTFTPFEKQFWDIKQNHYDTILFFQKGKFFELYENDADIGHVEFDLKLTDRVKMKMVGVPEGTFDFWAAKFLAKGYKVGRVDQSETQLGAEMRVASSKGKNTTSKSKGEIVRRELGKILTNGTLVDANMLHDDQAGHLVCIREDEANENNFGLTILDASTGEFNMSTFVDDVCGTKLETVIRQLRPKEILYKKGNLSVATTRLLKNLLPTSCIWSPMLKYEGLTYDDTLVALDQLYPAPEGAEDAMDVEISSPIPEAIRSLIEDRVAIESLGGMIWYLRTLNLDKEMLTMKNFCIYDPMRQGKGLILDGQTLSHIEVLRNSEGSDEGSLLKLLSNCLTPFGKRLFRLWLCMPLRDVKAINERLDAVEDLMDNPSFEDLFTNLAKGLPDLERVVSRIHAGSCKPKDFLKVLACFRTLSAGLDELGIASDAFKSHSISGLLRNAPDLDPYIENLENLFKGSEDTDDLVPVEGKVKEFDETESEIEGIKHKLEDGLKKLKMSVDPDLKFWHSAVGTKELYLVETATAQKNLPKGWTKNAANGKKTRWLVPEFAPLIRKLQEALETRKTLLKNFQSQVFADFDADRPVWLQAVRLMAELDCLFSLAKSSIALGQPSCRPILVQSEMARIEFEGLRHPSISIKNTFIPNDIKLGGDAERIMLLTGPNMGGKSTAMRMTAVGVIMAQLGMYIPARSGTLSPVDTILTRMGAYDNMFSNASTFKVEMDECCKILREASPKSLVILDELGRGTSTYDGMAIAGAVLHQLASHTLPLCCFATHYSSLTDDYAYHPNIRNMHMGTVIDEEQRKLVFTYKLTKGASEGSFGTHVASLAGVPSSVVDRAEAISKDFAEQFKKRLEAKRLSSSRLPLVAQADFAYLFKLGSRAKHIEVEDSVTLSEVLRGLSVAGKAYLQQ